MVATHSSIPLTAIKGIGPVKQKRLQQALAIETVSDLLALDIHEIQSRLAEVGPVEPIQEIRHWLKQAQKLMATEQVEGATIADVVTNQVNGKNDGEITSLAAASLMNGNRGTFQISLTGESQDAQMRVAHVESGDCWMASPTSSEALYEWLWAHLQKTDSESGRSITKAEKLEPKSSAIAKTPVIDILEVNATPVVPDNVLPGFLTKDQAFTIAVRFRIIATNGAAALEGTVVVAQFYARNRLTGDVLALGVVQDRIERLGVTQSLQSAPVMLTTAGIYQIQVLVTLQDVRAAAGYQELQFIQIT